MPSGNKLLPGILILVGGGMMYLYAYVILPLQIMVVGIFVIVSLLLLTQWGAAEWSKLFKGSLLLPLLLVIPIFGLVASGVSLSFNTCHSVCVGRLRAIKNELKEVNEREGRYPADLSGLKAPNYHVQLNEKSTRLFKKYKGWDLQPYRYETDGETFVVSCWSCQYLHGTDPGYPREASEY